VGDPARRGHRSSAPTGRAGLAAVPFLAAQAHAIIACDFLVVEPVQLRRLYVLVFARMKEHFTDKQMVEITAFLRSSTSTGSTLPSG
jgi:hypothetical protein